MQQRVTSLQGLLTVFGEVQSNGNVIDKQHLRPETTRRTKLNLHSSRPENQRFLLKNISMLIYLVISCLFVAWYPVPRAHCAINVEPGEVVNIYRPKMDGDEGSGSSKERSSTSMDQECSNDTVIIDTVLSLAVYNKHKLPSRDGVDVRVEFWIQEISAVSEITSDFELDLYISELWVDPALKYDHMNPCKKNLSFSDQILQRLWNPNNVFVDSKQAKIHESPYKNVFLMVWTNFRIKVTGPCEMYLDKFPMDTQTCFLTYESFSYNTDEVRLRWMPIPEPVTQMKPIKLPDYDLTNISTFHMSQDFPAGAWDDLKVTFTFQRRYVWYFLQAYLPTYLTMYTLT